MRKTVSLFLALLLILVSGCGSQSSATVQTAEELVGLTLSIPGSYNGQQFALQFPGAEALRCSSVENQLLALLDGTAQAAIMDSRIAKRVVAENPELEIVNTKLAGSCGYGFAVLKSNEDLCGLIHVVITEQKTSQAYRALLKAFLDNGTANEITGPVTGEKGTLVLGTTRAYAPFSYQDSNSNITGLDIEFAKRIAQKVNKTLEVRIFAEDQLLQALEDGMIDFAVTGLTEATPHSDAVVITPAYYTSNLSIVMKKK